VLSTAVQEYRARLNARCAARDALTAVDTRLAHAQLASFFSGVVLALVAWHSAVTVWWLLAPVAVFVWLVRRHDGVLRARELAIRGIGFYERGLARLEDRWPGTGETGERFRDDRHVYANDLDLFGRGSLFELVSLARTRAGEAMLAGGSRQRRIRLRFRRARQRSKSSPPPWTSASTLHCPAPTSG
jgi:hypothetical protein